MALISFFFNPKVFLGLTILCVLFAAVAGVVVLSDHAVIQHGSDAETVRRCLDKNGVIQIWTEKDGCTTHNLTPLDGQRKVGDQVRITGMDGQVYEKTSFIPRCGVLCKIEQWLQGKGAVQTWQK